MTTDNKVAVLEVTRQCNFNCPHCGVDAPIQKPEKEISTEQYKKFIDEFTSLRGKEIQMSGGEPLLREDLEEIMIYGRERGIKNYGIASNGSLLTESRMESLVNAGLDSMQISLDGVNPEQNAKIRGCGVKGFDRIIRGTKIANEYPINFSIGMILHPQNIDHIQDFIDICRELRVKTLRVSGFIPWGRARNQEILDSMKFAEEQAERFFRFISNFDFKHSDVHLLFDHSFGPFYDYYSCKSGRGLFYVCANGDVFPCTTLLHPFFKVGNLLEHNFENLKEILESPEMFKCHISADEITSGDCLECEDLFWCKGCCRGVTYAYTDDIHASFPSCFRLARKNYASVYPGIKPPPSFFKLAWVFDNTAGPG